MSNRVPAGWEAASFGDLCKFSGGSAFKEKYQGKGSGDYPFIKVSDMNIEGNQRFITKANHWIDQVTRLEAKVKLFPKPAVVFAKVGAALLLNRRRILTRETAIDNNMMAAIPFEDGHNFLYYALQEVDLGEIVQGGAVPSVNQAQMEDIPVLIPPLPEQQKIATILSSVDDVIEKTRAQIDKLKDLKTGMMQQLLTQGIGHTEYKDTPIGRIPKTWGHARLEDVAVIQTGVAKNSKITGDLIEIPYLRVANVQDGYLDLTEIKTLQLDRTRLERFMLRDNDILVNEGGDFDKLGRGFIWKNQISPCVHQNHVFVVRTNQEKLLPMFFNYLSGSQYGKQYYLGCAKQTTNLASLNSSQLKQFPVLLPTLEEQADICEALNSIDMKVRNIEQKLSSITEIKKALMQDLLTGKVRV